MTCKDCCHKTVCENLFEDNKLPWLFKKGFDEIFCFKFKDKSKIIELPCKIGDTIYEIVRLKGATPKILEETVDNVYPYGQTIKNKPNTNVFATTQYGYSCISFYDFGKTVFLTKEEAEANLREEIKNDF